MGIFDFLNDKNTELVYDEQRGKEEWKAAKEKLKAAGLNIHSGFYEKECPVGGCGSKLDIRDFGPRGRIDRKGYYIRVDLKDAAKAKEILAAK
jgi:hypothetical protein